MTADYDFEEDDEKREVERSIIKNKGLTRKRKKIDQNPRASSQKPLTFGDFRRGF